MTKSILITGSSSGIGLSAAKTLHERGYRVFASARKEVDVERLKSMGFESVLLNVNDSVSIQNALETVLEKTNGTLDALFNNAGYGQTGAIEDLTRDEIRAQFETNVFGPMELITHVLPIMRKQGHGRIIQNTSLLGYVAMPYYGAYNASKFALEGFTHTLRLELRGSPIFVSIIAPGPIYSTFRDNAYHVYQQTIDSTKSAHRNHYETLENYLKTSDDKHPPFTLTPDAVTTKLIHAIESKRPKAHYYVGFPAHLFAFLRRILSDNALDWVITKISRSNIGD